MMKRIFTVSALSLGMLTLNAVAHDQQDAVKTDAMAKDHHGEGMPHHRAARKHDHHGAGHAQAAHAGAVGQPGKAENVTRTMQVDMSDAMRFTPSRIEVKRGETVRFIVKNSGKIKHEMVLGSMKELKEHAEMMRKMPEMEHAEENMVSADPGKSGELIWHFTRAGKFDFACLEPGHFEAGMKGKVTVK
ncbi:MAG: cupredoxin family protein [Telluria sp.]|nr:cupredoxin family protein [Telluria sp.]